jgi:excinuclease ABC subunit C
MDDNDTQISGSDSPESPLESPPESAIGVEVIRAHLRTLPGSPGVYRMLGEGGDALYVGKAKNLRKRVANYTVPQRQSMRIRRMIAQVRSMEFVTTHTEAEALLLEANLIKRLTPRYNILLRDDKSFPYILVTSDHAFPRVVKYRGARTRQGEYFGPFASAGAVNESLAVLQRAFLLRTCADTVFDSRTRPCLLYQIKRCSGPCADIVSAADYNELVDQARAFLTGRSKDIQRDLAVRMQEASDAMNYEKAAGFRDRIRAMTTIQSRQDINLAQIGDADLIGLHAAGGQACIQVFFVRSGQNYGNRAYFPSHAADAEPAQILEAFIGQFYADKQPPKLILLSHPVAEKALLAEALCERAGHKVNIEVPQRGDKKNLVQLAATNAEAALGRRFVESVSQRRHLDGLAQVMGIEGQIERIEVYDNSHIQGTNAVGAMIVAGPDGFMKNAYRKFNIKSAAQFPSAQRGAPAGDDYAMMREVLTRRFSRALGEDPDRTSGQWPDLVLIDGGLGQLGIALEVFAELGVRDVCVCAIAKGPNRNAGEERLFLPGREPIRLDPQDPVLYFVQRLRDEAHRFAIGTHRAKRAKTMEKSPLDEIPNVGGARKKALLHHFGSARAVGQAGLADLEAVEGISKGLARRIYDWFHPEG